MDETESSSDKELPAWQALFDEIRHQQDERPEAIGIALIEGRASRDARVRECVLRHLPVVALGHAEWRDFLGASLRDRDRWIRMAAAETAHHLGFAEAIPLLLPLLEDRDALVRVEAVEALAALGAMTSAPRLARLLEEDPAYLVRGYAAEALATLLGPLAVPILEQHLRNERSPWARAKHLLHLCALGKAELLPAVLQRLKNRNYRIRCCVANNIETLVNPSNRETVIAALSAALAVEPTAAARSALEGALALPRNADAEKQRGT